MDEEVQETLDGPPRATRVVADQLPNRYRVMMIELIPLEHCDPDFLSLVQQIVNGAVVTLRARDVHLVHLDNWFDHKWLGWGTRRGDALRIPPFNPNRVCLEEHFVWDEGDARWTSFQVDMPLHVRRPGSSWQFHPVDLPSKFTALIWYSGNTITDGAGSLM